MKLLIEQADFNDIQYGTFINETTKEKEYIVEGIFMQAEKINKNKRFYPKHILEREVNNYQEKIKNNESLGELCHANSLDINFERASHIIKELYFKHNDVYGKAKILNNNIGNGVIKPLLNEHVKIGMSSRAIGSLSESNNGDYKIVKDDYGLICIDCVSNPSAYDAYVSLMESKEFFIENGMIHEKKMTEIISNIHSLPKKEIKEGVIHIFKDFLKSLNNTL